MKLKVLIAILCIQTAYCQNESEKLVRGKIILESGIAEGINIINATSEKSTISDSNGVFEIFVKTSDVLIFSSVNLEYLAKKIENEDLNSALLIVKMTPKTTELEEVIITKYPEINAISLGISPKGIKKYTPAERRIYTAVSSNGDALLNLISGRTAMLKKELVVEKKERLLEYLTELFKIDFYTTTLKIPTEYVKGFQYYCVEDDNFRTILKSKNKIKIEYALIEYAKKYNEIILEK